MAVFLRVVFHAAAAAASGVAAVDVKVAVRETARLGKVRLNTFSPAVLLPSSELIFHS